MRVLFIIIAFFTYFSLSAQFTDSMIIGSWQVKNYSFSKVDTVKPISDVTIITFFPGGRFQRYYRYSWTYRDSTLNKDSIGTSEGVTRGAWELEDGRKLELKTDSMFGRRSRRLWHRNTTEEIQELNDSRLVLKQRNLIYQYERIPPMGWFRDTIAYSTGIDSPVKKDTLYAERKEGKRTHEFISGEDIKLELNVKPDNDSIESIERVVKGYLEYVNDTSLTLRPRHEWTIITYLDGNRITTSWESNVLYEGNIPPPVPARTINLDNIKTVRYGSKSNGLITSGIIGLTLGSVSALIVAPLASIDYKTGKFNSGRYYRVAGWSLAAVGVSIPLVSIGTRNPYYTIRKVKS